MQQTTIFLHLQVEAQGDYLPTEQIDMSTDRNLEEKVLDIRETFHNEDVIIRLIRKNELNKAYKYVTKSWFIEQNNGKLQKKGRILDEFIQRIYLNQLNEAQQAKKISLEKEVSKQTQAAFSNYPSSVSKTKFSNQLTVLTKESSAAERDNFMRKGKFVKNPSVNNQNQSESHHIHDQQMSENEVLSKNSGHKVITYDHVRKLMMVLKSNKEQSIDSNILNHKSGIRQHFSFKRGQFAQKIFEYQPQTEKINIMQESFQTSVDHVPLKYAQNFNVKKIKVNMEDKVLLSIPNSHIGSRWIMVESIKLKLNKVMVQIFHDNEFDFFNDDDFINQCKNVAHEFDNLDFYQLCFDKIGLEGKYQDDLNFLSIYHKKIMKLKARSMQNIGQITYHHKEFIELAIQNDNPDNSFFAKSTNNIEKEKENQGIFAMQKKTQKTQSEIKIEKLIIELVGHLTSDVYLFNKDLTKKLAKMGSYEILIEIIRRRIRETSRIRKLNLKDLFVRDFKIILKNWDKVSIVTMNEITNSLLTVKSNVKALTNEVCQKNIIKILLTNVHNGVELLARVPISSWRHKLDKELLNAFESHLKEPYSIIYSLKPLVVIVLMKEFLEKLKERTYKYQNKCEILSVRLLQLGQFFVKEFKTEEFLRFYADQKDSRERSALEIMSKYKYYEMLESNQMGLLIQEKWQGLNSQNFGLFEASKLYSIISSGYAKEDARRLFKIKTISFSKNEKKSTLNQTEYVANESEILSKKKEFVKEDPKIYLFQYYLWPNSSSLRYKIHTIFIFSLAIIYQIIISQAIQQDEFDDPSSNKLIKQTLIASIVLIVSINVNNLQEIIFIKLTKRQMRLSYFVFLDLIMLVGVILQHFDIPQLINQGQDDQNQDSQHDGFMSELFGRYLLLVNVTVSSLFLMNMIVAVLSGVYQRITQKTEADYNAYLVQEEYYLRWNKKYGFLIFAPPPLNLIAFVFLPIFLLVNHFGTEKTTKKCNKILTKILYLPIAMLFFGIFQMGQFFFVPLAYFKGIVLISKTSQHPVANIVYGLIWLVFGIFILLIRIVIDSIKFFTLLYRKTETFKKKEYQFSPKILNCKEQQAQMQLIKNQNESGNEQYMLSKFIKKYKNFEQVQKFGYFIGRKEIFALSRELRQVIKDEQMLLQQTSLTTSMGKKKDKLKTTKEFAKRWYKTSKEYKIPEIAVDVAQIYFGSDQKKKQNNSSNLDQSSILAGNKNYDEVYNLYQKVVFQEYIAQLSNLEKFIDSEKLRRVILDEISLIKMNEADFEEYRLKLFHTNINLLDKAIEKTKHGQKANKLQNRYLSQVGKNLYDVASVIDDLNVKLHEITVMFSLVDFKAMRNLKYDQIFKSNQLLKHSTKVQVDKSARKILADKLEQNKLDESYALNESQINSPIQRQKTHQQRQSVFINLMPFKSTKSSKTEELRQLFEDDD
eukprot:403347974